MSLKKVFDNLNFRNLLIKAGSHSSIVKMVLGLKKFRTQPFVGESAAFKIRKNPCINRVSACFMSMYMYGDDLINQKSSLSWTRIGGTAQFSVAMMIAITMTGIDTFK